MSSNNACSKCSYNISRRESDALQAVKAHFWSLQQRILPESGEKKMLKCYLVAWRLHLMPCGLQIVIKTSPVRFFQEHQNIKKTNPRGVPDIDVWYLLATVINLCSSSATVKKQTSDPRHAVADRVFGVRGLLWPPFLLVFLVISTLNQPNQSHHEISDIANSLWSVWHE